MRMERKVSRRAEVFGAETRNVRVCDVGHSKQVSEDCPRGCHPVLVSPELGHVGLMTNEQQSYFWQLRLRP